MIVYDDACAYADWEEIKHLKSLGVDLTSIILALLSSGKLR